MYNLELKYERVTFEEKEQDISIPFHIHIFDLFQYQNLHEIACFITILIRLYLILLRIFYGSR